MPNRKKVLKKIRLRKMDHPPKSLKKANTVMGDYPSRSTYQGDGGLMRLTGGVLPFEFSSASRDMDHKPLDNPVSASKRSKKKNKKSPLFYFNKDVD